MYKEKFNKIKTKILRSEFNRNVLILMTGTTIAQAIPIAITPILTRIYTPEDFGVFAIFIAITSIFSVIVNWRYEIAIMLPKKDEEAINILALGFIISCIISLILLILVFFLKDFINKFFENKELGKWLFFIPLSVFVIGLWNLLNYYNIRKKNYKDLSKAKIIKSIILSISQIGIGIMKSGAIGLISSNILSQLFANTKLILNLIKNKTLISKISKKKMISLAKKYQDFPKHNLPAGLSNTAATQLPMIFLPKLYGVDISGYFFLANNLIVIPSALLGKSISEVFFQQMSLKNNNKFKCWPFFIQTVKSLICIGLPFSIFIILFGPSLFSIVFGEQWKVSGEIASYLAVKFLFIFCTSPVSSVFEISGYIKRGAFWKYLYFLTKLSLFIFSALAELEFFEFLMIFIIFEIMLYLFYFHLIVKTVKQMDKKNI
jgi:O-antigen/teichoic acid export membrane protein